MYTRTKVDFRSGLSVAVHAATIQVPASIVLHMDISMACAKKSPTLRTPPTYLNRIMEQMVPLLQVSIKSEDGFVRAYSVAIIKMMPTEILARRSIGEFQRIKTGRTRKMTSVKVLNAAEKRV